MADRKFSTPQKKQTTTTKPISQLKLAPATSLLNGGFNQYLFQKDQAKRAIKSFAKVVYRQHIKKQQHRGMGKNMDCVFQYLCFFSLFISFSVSSLTTGVQLVCSWYQKTTNVPMHFFEASR